MIAEEPFSAKRFQPQMHADERESDQHLSAFICGFY